MKRKFIAKIILDNNETLIQIEGNKYKRLDKFTSLSSILNASKKDFLEYTYSLPEHPVISWDFDFKPIIDKQFIFATGVTYEWSPTKLAETPEENLYKKLYLNERPMFFFKGTSKTIAHPNGEINLRNDSIRTIPEAEIVCIFNKYKEVFGFTLGNDQTAIDLEQENQLYQAQAKFYSKSASLLPLILIENELPLTELATKVIRKNNCITSFKYTTQNFNRELEIIGNYLFKMDLFHDGVFLFLGCGGTFPDNEKLLHNDIVTIESDIFPIKLINKCHEINI